MTDTWFWLIAVGGIVLGLLLTKGPQWFRYKAVSIKRRVYLFIGRCPKCGEGVSYTAQGRPICTNGECRK